MTARVKDVMTRNVVAVHNQAGYKDIIAVMRRHGFRYLTACPHGGSRSSMSCPAGAVALARERTFGSARGGPGREHEGSVIKRGARGCRRS